MARFNAIPDYQSGFARGACYLCATSRRQDEDFVVDLHTEVEGEGYMAICIACATEIGEIVGLVTQKRLDKAEGEAARLRDELAQALAALEDRDALESLLKRSLDEVEEVKA